MTSEPTRLAIRLGSGDNGVVVATRLRVVPVALALTALHLALTWWRLARSWWWQDDLNLLGTAADRGFFGLLFEDYNGHLVPASWASAWLVDRVAPLSWGLGGGIVFLIVLATDLALLAALVRMFGDRPAILLPFALWCSTSLTLTSVVWWAAAMQWMPTCLALGLALYFHFGYVEKRDRRNFAGSLGAVALGLFFFEKALTIPVVLALITALYLVPGPLRVRPWRGFRSYVPYWLAHAALAGGYLAFYLSKVRIETGGDAGEGQAGQLTKNMLLENFVPGLFGGPVNWYTAADGGLGAWPSAPDWLAWLSWLLAAAVVIGSIVLIRGAWRAWLILGLFLAFSVALLATARLGVVGPFIGLDHRYLTDAAPMGVLCIALAWIPLRGGLDRAVPGRAAFAEPGRARVRPGRRTQLVEAGRRWRDEHRPQTLVAGALAVVVVTVLGAISGDRFMRGWENNPTESYLTNLRNDLALAEPKPPFLFEQELPTTIMLAAFGEARQLSHVVPALGVDRPRIGTSAAEFKVVRPDGHLVKGAVDGAMQTPPNGAPLICSRPQAPTRGVTLTMALHPPNWVWKAEIAYSASKDTKAMVRYGEGPKVPVRLVKGLNTIYVSLRGGGPGVSVTDLDPGAFVCLGGVRVGNAIPAAS